MVGLVGVSLQKKKNMIDFVDLNIRRLYCPDSISQNDLSKKRYSSLTLFWLLFAGSCHARLANLRIPH